MGWLIAIGGGGYAVFDKREAAVLALIVGTGFMTVLLAQLDKFEVLKGAGIEVKVRQVEQARKEVEDALAEAKRARAEVRQAAIHLVAGLLRDLARAGLWGAGQPLTEKIATRDRLRGMLLSLGTTSDEADAATSSFDDEVHDLLALWCAYGVAHALQKRGNATAKTDVYDWTKAKAKVKGGTGIATAELEELIAKHEAGDDPEVSYKLQSLRQFEQTGTIPADYDKYDHE